MQRTIFDDDHEAFRATARAFARGQIQPRFLEWEERGIVDRQLFAEAGRLGLISTAVPEQYGGGGVADFRFNQILHEEVQALGAAGPAFGLAVHSDICVPYFIELANDEQRQRWLPGLASGHLIAAIAMTEPGTGSDLAALRTSAIRDGDHYVLNGTKTFITNGVNADVVVVAAKTDPNGGHAGVSLLVVERDMAGFERGRKLEKLGLHSQDTAELSFHEVRVPVANLLGTEGHGFRHLMRNLAQERTCIAIGALASARAALEWTRQYCVDRVAFGTPIGSFQANKFALAEMRAETEVATHYLDQAVLALNARGLDAADAAIAKMWCTEVQQRVVDRCLQLHGGYGYMMEYPIARAYADARVTRIFGGTNEIMREIVGRQMGF